MKTIDQIIKFARDNKCSDIHLTYNLQPVYRRNGSIFVGRFSFSSKEIESAILSMLADEHKKLVDKGEDIDFCYTVEGKQRQRVNIYYQKGRLCAALRVLNDDIPTISDLNLPPAIERLANLHNGLVLVTGATGSGKSTTLAAMIDYINTKRRCHILTFEDPIEYVHQHKNSIIHQREVGVDVPSYELALKSALREDPDVILLGEMRDLETISAAITAAETGHLVLSTLHTTGAANTIDRIIDVFPDAGKSQVRIQLAGVLRGVVTQQLVPLVDDSGRCAAFEILLVNDAVSSLIREGKCFQINSILQTNTRDGMCSLNNNLGKLVREGKISFESAWEKSTNKEELKRYI